MTGGPAVVSLGRRMLPAATKVHRLSVEDVHRMVDAGVLQEEDRVELIDGVLVDVSPSGTEHSGAVAWLTRHFVGASAEREVRIQDVPLVEGGFVLPDLMVIDPLPRDRHPSTAALVIEVAVTTQSHDAWKANRYAGAGVGEYWLVDLPASAVIVHRGPAGDGYRETARYGEEDRIATLVGVPDVEVAALLGRPAT